METKKDAGSRPPIGAAVWRLHPDTTWEESGGKARRATKLAINMHLVEKYGCYVAAQPVTRWWQAGWRLEPRFKNYDLHLTAPGVVRSPDLGPLRGFPFIYLTLASHPLAVHGLASAFAPIRLADRFCLLVCPSPTLAPGLAVRMVTVRVARIYAPLIGHAPLFPGRGSSRPDPALALPFPVSATLLRSFRPKRQCCCSQNVRCAGCALWAAGVHAAHRPRGVSFPVPATILRAAPDSSTRAAAPKTFTARCRRSARTFAVRTTGVDAWLIDIPLSFWCPGHFCAPAASTQFGLCYVQARSTVPGASRTAINHKCKKRLYLVSALQDGEGNGGEYEDWGLRESWM
ncbi:hypothetical protein C8R44DRAFT_859165 [Mycena epipterygia]|nr:hypothetical protein C8R44DRAFT_859165 [Mycena epipterygia]